MKKIVSNQLSPAFPATRALAALGAVRHISSGKDLDFVPFFGTKNYRLLSTARGALGVLADALALPKGKTIALPAFICAVVATPFIARGYRITWVDTDDRGLMDPYDLARKIRGVGLVVVPHVFGQKADIEHITRIAHRHHIPVVEDGAHFFNPHNGVYSPSRPGEQKKNPNLAPSPDCRSDVLSGEPEYADYKLWSFGREKDVSCVSGGALVWKSGDPVGANIVQRKLPQPNTSWAIRHALQPGLFALALPLWHVGGSGKAFLKLCRITGLLPAAVTSAEKYGHEDMPIAALHPVQQHILRQQLLRRAQDMAHRTALAEQWQQVLSAQFGAQNVIVPPNAVRVIVRGVKRHTWVTRLRRFGFDLGEWDGHPIAPSGVRLSAFGYKPGMCPHAETFNESYLTFPTNPRTTAQDIERFATLPL